jgi:hypothetical protein
MTRVLPDTFAMCCPAGRWQIVAPADHEFRARTYKRQEIDSGDQIFHAWKICTSTGQARRRSPEKPQRSIPR